MTETKKEVSVIQAVKCGKVKHGGLVTLSECEACPYHKGIDKVFEGKNDLPDLFEITCALPQRIRTFRLITGGLNASTE